MILERLGLILGAVLLALIGPHRFYYAAQRPGLLGRLARPLLASPWIRTLIRNQTEYEADVGRDRLSTAAQRIYADDSLAGWGEGGEKAEIRGDRHLPLEKQMRSIALPDVVAAIGVAAPRQKSPLTIVEIGTGDGDLVAKLAADHPSTHVIGVDLSVTWAEQHHKRPNLALMRGYALELLEDGTLTGDILFASSTFVVFTPLELERYFTAIEKAGFSTLVLVDPLTRKYDPARFPDCSLHMAPGMWGHDYQGALRKRGGWEVERKIVTFTGHRQRAEVSFQKVVARRTGGDRTHVKPT